MKEWLIAISSHTTWSATHADRAVELAYPPTSKIHTLTIDWKRSTQIHSFTLQCAEGEENIVLLSHPKSVESTTQGVNIQASGSGYLISRSEGGSVWFGCETTIRTEGFEDRETEAAFVWMAGTLRVINFPNMLD